MKHYWVCIVCLMGLWAFQSPKMTRVKITDGISIQIPQTFVEMGDNEIASKYFTSRRPLKVFTDESGKVDFGVNISPSAWDDRDVDLLRKFYKSSIQRSYPKVEFIQDKITKYGNREYAVIEFVGEMPEDKEAIVKKGTVRRYHYMQYAAEEGQIVIFNFNCPSSQMQKWKPIAKKIMESAKVSHLGVSYKE